MASFDFASIGDCVLRLSTGPQIRLHEARSLNLDVSGSEMNVSCTLAALGKKTTFASCLPDTKLGRRAALPLRQANVETSQLLWRKSGRVSTYYVEYSPPPQGSSAIYDRTASCFDKLQSKDINWDALTDARMVHVTGITAALSERGHDLCQTMLATGRQAGAMTSVDVNYRKLLWQPQQARKVLTELLALADICFCPLRDAKIVFGLDGSTQQVAQQLASMTAGKRALVSNAAMEICGIEGQQVCLEPAFPAENIDRIGAGDGMVAGVLHGILDDDDFATSVKYGAALAALAMGQRGEQLAISAAELAEIASAPRTGIQR